MVMNPNQNHDEEPKPSLSAFLWGVALMLGILLMFAWIVQGGPK